MSPKVLSSFASSWFVYGASFPQYAGTCFPTPRNPLSPSVSRSLFSYLQLLATPALMEIKNGMAQAPFFIKAEQCIPYAQSEDMPWFSPRFLV